MFPILICFGISDRMAMAERKRKSDGIKILVCVRQVPCLETPEAKSDVASEWRMNRYDEYAVESALRLADMYSDVRVDVLSAGPGRVRDVIRRALAMGADFGIHIPVESEMFADPGVIAGIISGYAESRGYDLIFTGVMSEDAMRAAVGPMIAAEMELPCASAVISISLEPENRYAAAECEMESGRVVTARLNLPALLTIQSGNHTPRYPSLSNTLRARKQDIETAFPEKGIQARASAVSADGLLPETPGCRILEGTAGEKAETLLRILAEKDLLQ